MRSTLATQIDDKFSPVNISKYILYPYVYLQILRLYQIVNLPNFSQESFKTKFFMPIIVIDRSYYRQLSADIIRLNPDLLDPKWPKARADKIGIILIFVENCL